MAQQNYWTDDAVVVPGIRRKPIGDDAAPMDAPADAPPVNVDFTQPGWAPPDHGDETARQGEEGSGSGPREGVIGGNEPPQMPTQAPETPRVEYGGSTPTPPPPQPSMGGPMGAPGPSTATPSMPSEPTPVAGQSPNPSSAGGPSAPPPVMPPPFEPMQAPLGGQQIAQAAYPIERQDPASGGWAGASDATASYPITRRPIGAGRLTGQANALGGRMLGQAGGLLGGGLGVPGQLGGSTQESTDIGNLIASLYRMANQNTQG